MLDDDDDLFLLDDDDSAAKKAEQPLGLCVPEKFGPAEIEIAEAQYRKNPNTGRVMFTEELEDGTGEVWADGQPEKWRRYMGWPPTVRTPSVEEGRQWQLWAENA